jgi:hypothetical protein
VSRKTTAKQYLRTSKKRVYLPPIIATIDNIKGSFDMRQQILREKALPTLSTRYQISAIEDEGAQCWTTSMVQKTKTSSLSPRSKIYQVMNSYMSWIMFLSTLLHQSVTNPLPGNPKLISS